MNNSDLIKIQKINSEMQETFLHGKELNKQKAILIKKLIKKRLFEVMTPYTWQVVGFSRGSPIIDSNICSSEEDSDSYKTTLRLRMKNYEDNDNPGMPAMHHSKRKLTRKKSFASKRASFITKTEEDFIKKMMNKNKIPSFEDIRLLAESSLNSEIKYNKDIEIIFNYSEISFRIDNDKVDSLFDLLKKTNLSINLSSLISEIDEMEAAISYRKRMISELSKNLLFNC